jgi:hypothetical protein
MKISRLIPKDSYFRSANGPLAVCSIVSGVVVTILIGMAIFQMPLSGNLWLALAVSVSVVAASVAFMRSDRRDHGCGGESDGVDTAS